MSKFVNLEQIKVLANKVKSEDAALGTKLETVTTKVDNLVAAGGEANILEGVKVNGAALAISDKMVDILIASGEENGTISVNGAAVAIKGLAALAYKSEITEDDFKVIEKDMQKLTDDYIKEVERIADEKEKELMEI